MARPPLDVDESVFVREVDEELEREQLLSLWQRFGKPAIAVIVAGLLGWAGWLYWEGRRDAAYGLEGEKLTSVVEAIGTTNDKLGDAKLRGIIASDARGFQGPAGLTLGARALQAGDVKAAVKAFGDVAADPEIPQLWRDLALIRQTSAEFDMIKPEEVVARLKPLASKGKPWFGSAGELVAMAYVRMNKPQLAAATFLDMSKDEGVPEIIRDRANEMSSSLSAAAPSAAVASAAAASAPVVATKEGSK